ncbi:MAG: hypothetical protein R2795_25505 [Saprospiraceae bacterium]
MGITNATKEQQQLARLREALLHEDRKALAQLQQILDSEEEISKRVDPIIEAHLDTFRQHFPDAYIRVVQKIVDQRMTQKQDELMNILYPRLGLMIRKFITNEFRLLREKIDQQINQSPISFLWRRRNKNADQLLLELSPSMVEEVYVISHESGLLLGSASSAVTADKDMIAGMLTAIKSFAVDAFRRTDEELRAVQYGGYEIMVQNFYNYYIALAIAGVISEQERDDLARKMLEFAAKELCYDLQEPNAAFYARLQTQLKKYFIEPYQQPQS